MANETKTDKAAELAKTPEQLELELREATLRIAELTAQNKSLAEGMGSEQGRFERASGSATRFKKLWKFKCYSKTDPKLEVIILDAVDESEALRQYALKASGDPNKPIDTVKHILVAECQQAKERKAYGIRAHDAWREERGYERAGKQQQAA